MNLAFVLHIYQPPIQDGKVIKSITETCYLPLFKLIKNKPNFNLTLNIPLSLSYQLHKFGYDALLKNIRELYETERIELTGSGAYHPLLTKLPKQSFDQQIILNEYGLGYYFGKDKGFEGEEAILIKSIVGFFPPELALNSFVIKQLDSLGYSWVLGEDISIIDKNPNTNIFKIDGLNIKLAVRDSRISNLISFKRDSNINDILDMIIARRQETQDLILAMDGEVFGHHYDEGIYMLGQLIDALEKNNINLVTVSNLISNDNIGSINEVRESTWGSNSELLEKDIIYPLWDDPTNKIHKAFWEILDKTANVFTLDTLPKNINEPMVMESFPIWDLDKLSTLSNLELKNAIYKNILFQQCQSSDQFWWASQKTVNNKLLYDPEYIKKSLELYLRFAVVYENKELETFIREKSQEILLMIKI